MKKTILLLFAVSFFTFNCSNEDAMEVNDQNINLDKSISMADLARKLNESREFKNFISSNNHLRSNQGNGQFNGLIQLSEYNLSYFAFDDTGFYLIGGEGSVEEMPNGKAKFSIHTNSPSAAVLDTSFTTVYSSDCIEGPLGTFNYNYISDYIVEVFEPVPGLVFTFYTPTGENASAESRSGHCNMSDAQAMFDENFEFTGCTDATDYKVMRLGPSGISLE